MEYQTLSEKFKINIEKNIGSVVYIVEGEKREINLLGYIFKEILKYDEVVGIDRNGKERIKYINKKNRNSRVFIINSQKSNVQSITNDEFIKEQIEILKNYGDEFNYEHVPIYYIFDCDREKDQENIRSLISMYINAREPSHENRFDSIGGMLLLSYPAIETFIISNFETNMSEFDKRFNFENKTLKEYINDNHYDNHKISIKTVSNAFKELVNSLKNINVNTINLDNTQEFNNKVFKYEQIKDNKYMLSLLLISFIDLGIIEIIEK